MPKYWLAKSEPDVFSIDDLKKKKTTDWDGVRNYQARNYLREMKVGDKVLFYHSNAKPPGVAGIAEVTKDPYPDPSQFDKSSEYFDEKASKDNPRWFCPQMRFVEKFNKFVSLDELKASKQLQDMQVVKKGSRLSVHPVTKVEFDKIVSMGSK